MGLEQVIGEVRRDGEERAQAILDAAQAEAAKILAGAQEKVDAYAAARTAQAERDAVQAAGQIASRAESEARKIGLTAEAELRAELKQTIMDGFAQLDSKVRAAHIKKLLATAKAIVGEGSVHGAKADATTLKAQKTYTYGGDVAISGGIIVEAKDGRTRLDLSYETLVNDMWREVLRSEAALFE